jgi:hypothetical protein
MSVLAELSKKQFAAAVKVARGTELEFIALEQGHTNLSESFVDRGRKMAHVDLQYHRKVKVFRPDARTLRTRMSFKLVGQDASSVKKPPFFTIRSVFVVQYQLPEKIEVSQAECQSFADANGVLNCWPYWREFIQSSVSRMGLPPLTVPFFKVRQKQEPEVARGEKTKPRAELTEGKK